MVNLNKNISVVKDKMRSFIETWSEIIVVSCVVLSISYNDFEINGSGDFGEWLKSPGGKMILPLVMISSLFLLFKNSGNVKGLLGDKFTYLIYGLYVISIYSYTFYQWDISSKQTNNECSLSIPRTKNFSKSQYYLYRVMYLATIIMIVILIQHLTDKGGNLSIPIIGITLGTNFTMLLPLLLPIMTETINSLISYYDSVTETGYEINPESLLVNFMLGDSKNDLLDRRLIGPIIFYLLLMAYAYYSSYYEGSSSPIYILLAFVMGFSVWMRTIFVQDCSLKTSKNISKVGDEEVEGLKCKFEKYGGLQAIIATCFMINILSYIKNPTYKLFIFVIIGLSSGLISSLFIMNLK
jgi:hypothetical protein